MIGEQTIYRLTKQSLKPYYHKIHYFNFKENFNYPYISKSIKEFWKRWHISLSTWFKDYLYIPLGGNRVSSLVTQRNVLIVFVVSGLWHGASYNFLIWGFLHGCFYIIENFFDISILDHTIRDIHIYSK